MDEIRSFNSQYGTVYHGYNLEEIFKKFQTILVKKPGEFMGKDSSLGFAQAAVIGMDYLRSGYDKLAFNITTGFGSLQYYFWEILFCAIVIYILYTKFLSPCLSSLGYSYNNYKKRREEQEYAAKYHKDPDLLAARLNAQQTSIQKLQEKYNQDAEIYQAKLKEKEEQKRQEIENLLNQNGGGRRLGSSSNDTPKSLRSEYNPLMGSGSSSNYRAPKRSKCGGGGCG